MFFARYYPGYRPQPVPVVNLGSDTTLCAGQGLALNATTSGATYQWNDNSTMPTLQVNNSGTFAVTVTVNGCSATDNMVVAQSNTPPAFSLGNDTAYCNGFLQLSRFCRFMKYGVTAPQIAVNAAGTYWASVSSGCGTASDTIVITQATVPIVNLGNDTELCAATLLLGAFNAGATYLWQDASTSATYNVLGRRYLRRRRNRPARLHCHRRYKCKFSQSTCPHTVGQRYDLLRKFYVDYYHG